MKTVGIIAGVLVGMLALIMLVAYPNILHPFKATDPGNAQFQSNKNIVLKDYGDARQLSEALKVLFPKGTPITTVDAFLTSKAASKLDETVQEKGAQVYIFLYRPSSRFKRVSYSMKAILWFTPFRGYQYSSASMALKIYSTYAPVELANPPKDAAGFLPLPFPTASGCTSRTFASCPPWWRT